MSPTPSPSRSAALGNWAPRLAILVALVGAIWLAGPKAYAVLSHKFAGDGTDGAAAARLDLSRVGLKHAPEWLRGSEQRPILESVLLDLEPVLRGEVRVDDPVAVAAWKEKIANSPWVAAARYPESREVQVGQLLGVELDLRRPEIAVIGADRTVVYLVDRDGIVLPPPVRPPAKTAIPRVVPRGPVDRRRFRPGLACRDAGVLAAAAVAYEWRTRLVPGCLPNTASPRIPALLEIDTSNLGGAFLGDPRYSEVAVALAGQDDSIVWMQYGRAESAGGAIAAETKAWVLAEVLTAHPELEDLAGGDLRLRNRWRDCLVLRAPRLSSGPRAGSGSGAAGSGPSAGSRSRAGGAFPLRGR